MGGTEARRTPGEWCDLTGVRLYYDARTYDKPPRDEPVTEEEFMDLMCESIIDATSVEDGFSYRFYERHGFRLFPMNPYTWKDGEPHL